MNRNDNDKRERKKGGILLFFERIHLRRLFALMMALLLTGVVLSGSTYAWFTSNFTVTVKQIDVSVASGSGIQISTNATDWKTIITTDDILNNKYTNAVNQIPDETELMIPVSTINSAYASATPSSQGLKMFKGVIVNDVNDGTPYLNSSQDTDGVSPDYVAFDLFIKLDNSTAQQIYLTSNTGVTAGEPNTHIEYASRIGFVVNGNTPSSDTVANMTALKGASNVFIVEPNYDVHTSNGLANGRDNYGMDMTSNNGYNHATGNTASVPYYGVKSEFTYDLVHASSGVTLNSHDSSKFSQVTPDIKIASNNTSNIPFMTLNPGVTKIRVYMWVEGQDIDCENTASGGQILFSLGFTLEE